MSQLVEPTEPEAQRAIIKLALEHIVNEIGISLSEAQLDFPVYVSVPNSGSSIATMACPLDPTDTQWFASNSDRMSHHRPTAG